jgi:hypothetical protein
MDENLHQELLGAETSEDKAAVVAESLLHRLPEETAQVARRCIILHWFDKEIIAALSQDVQDQGDIYEQLKHLPFVEALPRGLAFNGLTQEGLLRRYAENQPDVLQTGALSAAPAYEKQGERDKKTAAEAFFCFTVAGDTARAIGLLKKLVRQAKTKGDWEYIGGLFQLQDEAERIPFVSHLQLPEEYRQIRRRAFSILVNPVAEEKTLPSPLTPVHLPIKVFLCYAHQDEESLGQLKTHLAPLRQQGLIEIWDDGAIPAGTVRAKAIIEHLNAAQIILLLISPDLIDSEYGYRTEMQLAIEQHEKKDATVIPIITRPVDWENIRIRNTRLGDLQAFPKDAKPVLVQPVINSCGSPRKK